MLLRTASAQSSESLPLKNTEGIAQGLQAYVLIG